MCLWSRKTKLAVKGSGSSWAASSSSVPRGSQQQVCSSISCSCGRLGQGPLALSLPQLQTRDTEAWGPTQSPWPSLQPLLLPNPLERWQYRQLCHVESGSSPQGLRVCETAPMTSTLCPVFPSDYFAERVIFSQCSFLRLHVSILSSSVTTH